MNAPANIVRAALVALLPAALLLAGACGGDPFDSGSGSSALEGRAESAFSAAPTPAIFGPTPTAVPAAFAQEDAGDGGADANGGSGGLRRSPLPQTRVIVHTAKLNLIVADVAQGADRIRDVALELGGWLVSSDRESRHSASISVRVPAQSLTDALDMIEAVAQDVLERDVSSEDVTDRYVDAQSRLAGLRATETRLREFLDLAANVEEALLVQEQLGAVQLQIEEMQGRINYYDQVSAFSLIEARLTLAPLPISVDAGPDAAFRVGETARFRATFAPPDDIETYTFVWDFGDGSSISGSGSAPLQGGRRVTATVNHVYADDKDSPYIVSILLNGTGEGGVAVGEDTLIADVKQVPSIEAFAGDSRTVEEGESVRYAASFTAPDELTDYDYQWNFGDGSPTVSGQIESGSTRVEVERAYVDYRPNPYAVRFTVSAMSDAGRVTASDTFEVYVVETEGFLIGGWDAGDTLRAATRALSAVGVVALTLLIWGGVFIPVIAVAGIIAYLANRAGKRSRARRQTPPPSAPASS